jgi:polysaccharide biosynthesis transport protein
MSEVLDEEQPAQFDLQRIVGIVRRRHLQFLVPLFCGWLLVWGVSWVLPPRYKSITTILVEQPSVPQSYVAPNVSDDLQARLESIKTQLESHTRLLTIINDLHLYSGNKNAATIDSKINQMRDDIDVELVRDSQRDEISAFTVSYTANNPRVAQEVTRELTDLFISENNKVVQQESQSTTTFIADQLDQARQSLSEQEAKVHEFEGQHEGALPTQEASNLQILSGYQSQLQNEQDALSTAKQQRVYLQALLDQQRAALSKVRPITSDASGAAVPTDLASVDQQLDKFRAQLADLSSRYTDQYPDIQVLKHQIAKMETLRASIVAAEKTRSKQPAPDDAEIDPTLSGPAAQTQSSLQANQLEIHNRENAISELKAKIGEYQGRLNAEPATEQQLSDLSRGYDQSKKNYDDLLMKKDESEMATNMLKTEQGERFTMLDPPSFPVKPDFPNRLKFCGMGLGVGIALGFAVAGGFEFMDDRLHGEKEIKALLPVPVISEVPEVVSASDIQSTKRSITIGWATTAVVFITILAGSVFSYLHK